jgi:hypothetical protein
MTKKRSRTLREILRQARFYKIPVDQLVRAAAVRCKVAAGEVTAYLSGETGGAQADWTLGDACLIAISDITRARAVERNQLDKLNRGRRGYTVPRHPGIEGREISHLGCTLDEFLAFVELSEPKFVKAVWRKMKQRRARERSRRRPAPRPSPGGTPATWCR